MNIIIIVILFIILITLPSYIDNVEQSMIKSQFLRKNIIQILMNNQQEENMRKRFSRCIFPCQSHDCCKKSNCLCIRDYWGPICYCRK